MLSWYLAFSSISKLDREETWIEEKAKYQLNIL